jgi:hypothetical protein
MNAEPFCFDAARAASRSTSPIPHTFAVRQMCTPDAPAPAVTQLRSLAYGALVRDRERRTYFVTYFVTYFANFAAISATRLP